MRQASEYDQLKQINPRFWWLISISLSLFLFCTITAMWYIVDSEYKPNTNQLLSLSSAESNLIVKLKESDRYQKSDKRFIPTGIFIQSLNFNNSSDVNITGYVWQVYSIEQKLEHPELTPGFIFPEQVESGSNISPKLIYENIYDKFITYGWYFEATLRQEFDYKKYPLDHKTVWIRIWPSDFQRQSYLLPALNDYQSTSPGVPFGLDTNIVLGNWDINETFYDYKIVDYDTNFGLKLKKTNTTYPELYFNVVLKRKFFNSFIVDLVPILTVSTILFSLMMTLSSNSEHSEKMGFNINAIISVISALFFVVMLSHIHTREKFPSEGIVYIEYFFLIMYISMIFVIFNSFAFSISKKTNFITFQDNLFPKLMYWPVILLLMTLTSYFVLV